MERNVFFILLPTFLNITRNNKIYNTRKKIIPPRVKFVNKIGEHFYFM